MFHLLLLYTLSSFIQGQANAKPQLHENKFISEYYTVGQLKSITQYLNDVKHGIYVEWNLKGDIITSGTYKDNQIHGVWKNYQNDCLYSLNNFEVGKLHGVQEVWYFPGNSGVSRLQETYPNCGQIRMKENYVNDKLHGSWESWDPNGQLESKENYFNGKRHGLRERWYSDGWPESRENYSNGLLEGLRETWWEVGQLESKENYANGKSYGLWEVWDEKGVLLIRTTKH